MNVIKNMLEFVMDILETIVFIGSLFIITYLFIVQPNQVKGASMEPTFNSGDYIFTSKVTYRLRTLNRGDIVVFHAPTNPDIEYIKRIIGLPGDTILITNGQVYLNDKLLHETYLNSPTGVWQGGFVHDDEPLKVPQGKVFVMGDNRNRSSDSREFGPVPISSIVGQVFYRYFPPDKMGVIKNPLPLDLHATAYVWVRL